MEKAKAYDEALERAKSKIKNDKDHVLYEDDIIELFPALKESEDERIRKVIYELVEAQPTKEFIGDVRKDDCLAWLKKQREQEHVIIPKFKIGDVICHKNSSAPFTITGISNERYLGNGWSLPFSADKDYDLVEQKPWSEEDERIIIQIKIALGDFYPTSETDKIKNWFKSLKDRVQPKQEWSEEEIESCAREAEDNNCIILAKHIRQLKSLRPQSQWKPSENELEVLRLAAEKDGTCLMGLYENLKKLMEE